MLPNIINSILETTVSLKRIEDFLKQPDINKDLIKRGDYNENGEYAIKIEGGNFSWGVKQKKKVSRWFVPGKKGKKGPPGPPGGFNQLEGGEGFPPKTGFSPIGGKHGPKGPKGPTPENEKENNKKNEINTNSDSQRSTVQMPDPNLETPGKIDDNNPGNPEGQEMIRDGCKIQVYVPKGVDYDLTLKNINFEVKPGELVAIVGEVGCGKSCLLQAIINCLILFNPKECDGVHINGKIGYSAQIPWIQNDTIRNNITFSKDFDEEKYNRVLSLCQLNEDLETFEGKDLTEIGEKGVNLSGGQKVRISLARTIYNEPDIYLFDDPISALDANVGKKIMKNCIVKYLNGRTRIVVTHALSYLKYLYG